MLPSLRQHELNNLIPTGVDSSFFVDGQGRTGLPQAIKASIQSATEAKSKCQLHLSRCDVNCSVNWQNVKSVQKMCRQAGRGFKLVCFDMILTQIKLPIKVKTTLTL
jgi:hypothetical protein